jgi:tRNA threonylcarbamoyladenosine biosynthesis protein TsaB
LIILALDTALASCSVALWRDGAIDAGRFAPMDRGQSEAIMPMVRQVMAEAGAQFADIDLVAVTTGPGAFTGLRIGLAAARGLALAAGLPCLGVTTLEAVAAGIPAAERIAGTVLVVLETKRADVYAQSFGAQAINDDLKPLNSPSAVAPESLVHAVGSEVAGRLIVVGSAAPRVVAALRQAGVPASLSAAPGLPDAAVIAGIAAWRWRPGQVLAPPAPLYLKPPAVTRSLV